MDFEAILTTMCALFVIVIAGFFSKKEGLIDDVFEKKLSTFVIRLTCPSLIMSSAMGDTIPDRSLIVPLLVVSIITYVVLISLAYVLPSMMGIKRDLRGMYSFMLVYSNVGFIGYPVVASIFGQEAVFYASVLNVFNTLTVFVWGVMFISGDSLKSGFKMKLLYSPAMVATYVSVILVCLGYHTPKAVSMPLSLLGSMTVPSSLLVIGGALASMPARKMVGTPQIFLMCAFKLLILPLAMFYGIVALGFNAYISAVNMVLIAMPVASFGTMFCIQMGKDETTMAQGTFWTTLLSLITIPLLSMLIS